MSDPRLLYERLEDVERLECYRPGGYHPIEIGNCLHERYRIVHKLGHGTFSTIWLARDEQASKYVAVKICTADAIQQEVDTLSRLGKIASQKKTAGTNLVPAILDRFSVQGPNGNHSCFVTAPARCSLADTREASVWCFQLDVARSLAAQLALAIAYIHEQGLVHGDLHLGNILLQFPSSLDSISKEQLYANYGAPEPEAVIRLDGHPLGPGVPTHAVPPVWFGERPEDIVLSDAKLMLADFGVAFWPSEESRFESYTPLEIRPPESRFEPTIPLSFASDIWSLGCTIWAMLSSRSLFDVMWGQTQDDVTAQQVDVLGPLPAEWWEKWEAWPKYFTQAGVAGKPIEGRYAWRLDRTFEEHILNPRREKAMAAPNDKEREALFTMLRWMLTFKPGDRPTAKQVLETEWMREWALPECQKVPR